jgi:hypothetical protein
LIGCFSPIWILTAVKHADQHKDDEKTLETVTEGATLILDAGIGALTINTHDDDADRRVLRHRPPSQRFASNGANLVLALQNDAHNQDRADAIARACSTNGRCQMKRSMLGSAAAAALMLSVATAAAQLNPQTGGATAQSSDLRGAIRVIIMERLANEMQGGLQERVSQAADTLSQLTPEQRTQIRAAIRARLADDAREGLPAALSERLADRLGTEAQLPPGAAAISPDHLTKLRNAIHARLAEEMRERIADRLADAAATLASLSPEQRAQVLAAVRTRLGDEVKDRLGHSLAEEIGQKLSDKTVGSGAK